MQVGTVRRVMQRKSIPHIAVTLPSKFSTLGLRLACNCIHDSILGIHADWGVILGVNDRSLAAEAFHLNGFVCRQGRVLQDIGVETLRELRAGSCESEVQQGRRGGEEKGVTGKGEEKHRQRSVRVYAWHLTIKAPGQRTRDSVSNKQQLKAGCAHGFCVGSQMYKEKQR